MQTSEVVVGNPADQLPGVAHEPPAAFVQLSHAAAAFATCAASSASRESVTINARARVNAGSSLDA
jgi:hypothetical protein